MFCWIYTDWSIPSRFETGLTRQQRRLASCNRRGRRKSAAVTSIIVPTQQHFYMMQKYDFSFVHDNKRARIWHRVVGNTCLKGGDGWLTVGHEPVRCLPFSRCLYFNSYWPWHAAVHFFVLNWIALDWIERYSQMAVVHYFDTAHSARLVGWLVGWFLLSFSSRKVHGDVFRAPQHLMLFSALHGTGCQIAVLAFGVILFAMAGKYHGEVYEERGEIVSSFIVCYALTSFISGWERSVRRPLDSVVSPCPVTFFFVCVGIFFLVVVFNICIYISVVLGSACWAVAAWLYAWLAQIHVYHWFAGFIGSCMPLCASAVDGKGLLWKRWW